MIINFEQEILIEFLKMPLWSSDMVFEKFRKLPNSVYRRHRSNKAKRFLFFEGNKEKKVVLVAHADTVFVDYFEKHNLVFKDGFIQSAKGSKVGIGADDRAGCAILWLLKDSGHSLLITDGEEIGNKGSEWLMEMNHDIADKINAHQFMVQFDKRGMNEFKCYSVGTDEFVSFISQVTGYTKICMSNSTDISILCRDICGVNFSIGYYNEHFIDEKINIQEWYDSLTLAKRFLDDELPRFFLDY